MSKIPAKLTQEEFVQHLQPYLSKAKRDFVSKIPLYKLFNYILYILQPKELLIDLELTVPKHKKIKYHSVSYQSCNSNIIQLLDKDGSIVVVTNIIPKNHNDAYSLTGHLCNIFKELKQLRLLSKRAYFNADSALIPKKLVSSVSSLDSDCRKSPKSEDSQTGTQAALQYRSRFETKQTFA